MSHELGVLLGKGETQVSLAGDMANRHGLIAGATGTGKTVSLQVLVEGLSRIGVPSIVADVKGDLSGLSQPGKEHPKITERIDTIGIEKFAFAALPTVFWAIPEENGQSSAGTGQAGKEQAVKAQDGHPVRTTITDMGPALLARLMDLNETQEGILNIAFRFADDQGMLMLDMKDLDSTLRFVSDNANELKSEYGNISSSSVGAIQRRLVVLQQEGAEALFGEPDLDLWDLIRTSHDGRGQVNILDARSLMTRPRLYATFLLWLLSELFEELPEVGDQDKPRFVFFFDEAHLLFDDAPKALVDKIETVVKLIRSKGVGIYFITQNPLDVPDSVLGQLGNRIQHALRAFSPRDQKAVKAAAQTMRANPAFDTEEVIGQLGVGEALVSVLEASGTPSITQRVLMCPPVSRIGSATDAERAAVIAQSPIGARYDAAVDRESAYEILEARVARQLEQAATEQAQAEQAKAAARASKPRGRNRQSIAEAAAKTFVRAISSRLATRVVRGLLGSIARR